MNVTARMQTESGFVLRFRVSRIIERRSIAYRISCRNIFRRTRVAGRSRNTAGRRSVAMHVP